MKAVTFKTDFWRLKQTDRAAGNCKSRRIQFHGAAGSWKQTDLGAGNRKQTDLRATETANQKQTDNITVSLALFYQSDIIIEVRGEAP